VNVKAGIGVFEFFSYPKYLDADAGAFAF